MHDALAAFLDEQPDLVLGILFGSVNRGTERWESDVDVGVMADAPLSAERKKALIEALALRFGRPVDLVDLQTARGVLLHQILSTGTLVYAPDRTYYAELMKRHVFDQADFMPYYNRLLAARRRRWLDDDA
jgi:predicted nucleotidyltransferase